jgi:SAM-dependent methyltransferase
VGRLQFVQDDALNLPNYGTFDVVFCSGLLYHLENPRAYLAVLVKAAENVLILNTHYSYVDRTSKHPVSEVTTHEGLPGRWYTEFEPNADMETRNRARLSAWKNDRSFWILKPALQAELNRLGCWVFEHDDGRDDTENRTTFVCFKRNRKPSRVPA